MAEQHVVELDQLDLAVVRVAVYMLVDEARPVSTSNTPNVMMHGEVAGLGADEGGRWLGAVRAVIALWRNTSGFCFDTWCALRDALRYTERESYLLVYR